MRVVVISNTPRALAGWAECVSILTSAGHEVVDPGPLGSPTEIPKHVAGADGVLVGLNRISREVLVGAPALRVIAKPGIGVDNVDLVAATELGIAVCNTPGSNTDSVADHTMAMMLALTRNLFQIDAKTRGGQGWSGETLTPPQLTGKRLAIISTGNVGKAVAKRAKGFDMVLTAYDPYPDQKWAAELGVTYAPFPDVLRGADVVAVHAPLVEGTRGLIGAGELAMLQPHAIVLALSRGGVVDENALAAAVRDGRLAGAGVDVWATEPSTTSPLFGLANTVVTPHVAGRSPESARRSRVMSGENLVAALAGRPVHVVNAEVLSMPGRRIR